MFLCVNDTPTLKGAQEVLVQTLNSRACNLAWINENRLRVEKASGARLVTFTCPDTRPERAKTIGAPSSAAGPQGGSGD